MALSRYVEKTFGMKTRSIVNPVVASCQIAITQLLRNNPDRLGYIIVNLGANDMLVSFDEHPAANRGIFVANGGGILSLNVNDDYELVGYPVYGTAPLGATAIFVMETEGE